MSRTMLYLLTLLTLLGLSALTSCQQRPLTPAEIEDQHRFEMGCRPEDAQGYERNMPYCGGPK